MALEGHGIGETCDMAVRLVGKFMRITRSIGCVASTNGRAGWFNAKKMTLPAEWMGKLSASNDIPSTLEKD